MGLISLLATPSMLLIAINIVGLVLIVFSGTPARVGRVLLTTSAISLILLAFTPLPHHLIRILEERFPLPNEATLISPKGILLLGGAVNSRVTRSRKIASLNAAAERFTVAAALAHRYPGAVLVVSNGGNNRIDATDPFGYAEYRVLEDLGVARNRIIYERHSSNTFENAVLGKNVAKPKAGENWLLVTSASHMPRAVGAFRRAGFDVVPWPVDYRTTGSSGQHSFFARPSEGLNMSDVAVKEWIGLLAYWLMGRTSELFPSPKRQS